MTDTSNQDLQELAQLKNDELRAMYRAKGVMTYSGYLLLLAAVAMFGFLAYSSLFAAKEVPLPVPDTSTTEFILGNFYVELTLIFGALLFSIVGLSLLRSSGRAFQATIPDSDRELLEPLIASANKESIDLYVVLSSLSGATGAFRKIGFTGLPLATVVITLIFSLLSFLNPEFLELAKLTLGAFIGSFVQKTVDATAPTSADGSAGQ